jgi:hypothetical protein
MRRPWLLTTKERKEREELLCKVYLAREFFLKPGVIRPRGGLARIGSEKVEVDDVAHHLSRTAAVD